MFGQRYIKQFPAAGEIVIFDRSWYNRAGVEYDSDDKRRARLNCTGDR
jgi:Polyphosphate kinase 2 (PPK2)